MDITLPHYSGSFRTEVKLNLLRHTFFCFHLISNSFIYSYLKFKTNFYLNHLQSQLDLDNCVDIATISETYSLKQLRTVVYRYMCSHLVEFSRSPEFSRLHPAQLEHLLACDFPVDCPEVEVLDITLRWLQNAPLDNHRFDFF